ncbi:hypothetical protein LZK98_11700 [Sphingomonas cannabina]|uniref:hypothetical protein n=1 Tax=Sphingomonas cannabina TaxID=2899123 RepID=UPI001F1ECA3F|nr:hypothetical protein [Sphingomonas cannabina]UIJ43755.1 hypothetical protein LZK98_11700 [Sphingomonas cannabina]
MLMDRPIIFSAPMVRALLDGRKTQTRRLAKPRGKRPSLLDGQWSDSYVLDPGNAEWLACDIPFAVGDRLYVRESIYFWSDGHDGEVIFSADGATLQTGPNTGSIPDAALHGYFRMVDQSREKLGRLSRPSIHMPRWASRLTLIVEGVKVERLQDISEADAIREGVTLVEEGLEDPVEAYRELWNSLHGADAWDANPWVVAITFRVVRGNIDSLEAAHA